MVDLIRNMVVSDNGNPRQFLKGPIPANIGPGTLDRLRRAGALGDETAEVAYVGALFVDRKAKGKAK